MDVNPAQEANDFVLDQLRVVDPICLQGRPVPARRWLWENWVPLGAVTALYGDGGTGKSLLAQQLMTCCATGRAFLGSTIMPCRALGLFCEDDEDELHRRQDAINSALGLQFADLENMHWWSRVGSENLLMTFGPDGSGRSTPFFDQIVRLAKDIGAQLVTIDTAADAFGGNENIRPQVRQFISLLSRLAQAIDGAVILLAHPSQTGRTSGSGDGGSTAWNNSVRSRLYLKRQEAVGGNIPDLDVRILSRLKANYAQAGVDITLRYQTGAFALDGASDAMGDDGHYRHHAAEEAFMTGLGELKAQNIRCNVHRGQGNYAPKALQEKTKAAVSYSENELTAAMNRLIRAKRIASVEEGPPSRRRSYLVVMAPDLPGV